VTIFSTIRLRRCNGLSKLISSYVLVALICHLFVGHVAMFSYVLCFGQDGHVAVEKAGHDHKAEASVFSGQNQEIRLSAASMAVSPAIANEMSGNPAANEAQWLDGSQPCMDLPLDGDDDHCGHHSLNPAEQHLLEIGWIWLTASILLMLSVQLRSVKLKQLSTAYLSFSNPVLRRCVVLLI
jgi:hypothetical protein